jgi:heme O synthase-like polyprenyltransferase
MTERARIIAWWGYVVCVVAIFEIVFQLAGFAYAVGAALVSIAVLGIALKLIVGRLARRARRQARQQPSDRAI